MTFVEARKPYSITSVQLCMQNLATLQRPQCQGAFRREMKLTRPEHFRTFATFIIHFHKCAFQFSSSLTPREFQQ